MPKPIIEVTGFKELQRKIKQLPDKVQKKEVLKILRTSAKPTLQAAKREVPTKTGNLKKSLGLIKGKKGRSRENPTIYVGPRVGGRIKHNGWYGAIVHGGHRKYQAGYKRVRKRNSASNRAMTVKFVKGNPFIERAYNLTKGQVTADAEKKVAREIQKQIDRLSHG